MGDRRGATIGGAGVWGNGFLPAAYQGTLFRNGATPIVDLNRRAGMTGSAAARGTRPAAVVQREARGRALRHRRTGGAHRLLRTGVPHADAGAGAGRSVAANRRRRSKLYGLDDPVTEPFGRQCLLARRMVERGVRFVMAAARRGRRPLGRSRRYQGAHSRCTARRSTSPSPAC